MLVEESMRTKQSIHYKPSAFATDRDNSSDNSIQKEKSYSKRKRSNLNLDMKLLTKTYFQILNVISSK